MASFQDLYGPRADVEHGAVGSRIVPIPMALRLSDLQQRLMSAAPILTLELFEQLEARSRAHAAPIGPYLQPRLSDAEMAGIVAPLALSVPSEARTGVSAASRRGRDREGDRSDDDRTRVEALPPASRG